MQIIKNAEEKKTDGFGQVVFKYLPYWPLFLLLFAVSVGGTWLYLQYTTPMYEANARLLINDEMKGVEQKGLQQLDLLATNKTIENETDVIQSNTLVNKVVTHLNLYAPVYQAQKLRDVSAYTTSPVQIIAQNLSQLKEAKKVYFTYNSTAATVNAQGKTYPINQWVATPYGTLKFIANTNYKQALAAGSKLYFSLINPKYITERIVRNIKVSTSSKQSSILSLSYQDEVPDRAENILNDLLKTYNQASVTDKNNLAANTLNFLQDRLNSVEKDLNGIEKKLQQYKSQSNATDIGTQGRLFLENVSNNDQKLGDVNMQLAVLNQVESYVRSKDNSGGIVPSTLGVNDPTLSGLVDKLYSSELDYENLRKTTGDNNPLVLSVHDRIEKIKPSILENIQSQKTSLLASRNNISSTNGSYNSVLQTIPEKERQLVEISREQSIKSGIYTYLLQKKEEAALSYASNVPEAKIIDNAQAGDDPVSPNKKVLYLSSVLFALFAGIGIIFGKETLNRKIMFRQEIEGYTDRPIIGEIISQPAQEPVMIGYDKRTFIAEQFRMLRMSLSFMGISAAQKRILVTSSISGEGKSFVAANLALSLAVTGKKVVLVDFDLNNPSLSAKLGITTDKGVTDFLLAKNEAQDIIVKTAIHDNFYFIPAGELPDNPSELMMNGRTELLLNYLDEHFDVIMIDSAPVVPVTDAYVLSPYCDATLYIVRHGYTPKTFVQRIDDNNKINYLKNVAIVFNGIKSRGFNNKFYGYGYGYGYNYRGKKLNSKRKNEKLLQVPNS